MDSRNRKIEIQIRGIFALILNLNLEQVEEIKAEVEFCQIYQKFLRRMIFSSFGWLSEYLALRPFAWKPSFFLLKVCFWLPKSPFKPLFDAMLKRFIHYIKMFLWPDALRIRPVKDGIPFTLLKSIQKVI